MKFVPHPSFTWIEFSEGKIRLFKNGSGLEHGLGMLVKCLMLNFALLLLYYFVVFFLFVVFKF